MTYQEFVQMLEEDRQADHRGQSADRSPRMTKQQTPGVQRVTRNKDRDDLLFPVRQAPNSVRHPVAENEQGGGLFSLFDQARILLDISRPGSSGQEGLLVSPGQRHARGQLGEKRREIVRHRSLASVKIALRRRLRQLNPAPELSLKFQQFCFFQQKSLDAASTRCREFTAFNG